MLLIVHIILAITGYLLIFVALIGKFISHSSTKYDNIARASFLCFLGLFATGTGLVIAYHTSMLGACKEGLAYFVGLEVLYLVYRKLVPVSID